MNARKTMDRDIELIAARGEEVLSLSTARLGEEYFSIRPPEELCPDLVLKLTDLLAQWRLSHVQSLGGPSKVQFFSDRDDIAKMSKFHFYRYL